MSDPTWYHTERPAEPARPTLEGSIDCDVAIVGGGIAGCSTALHLCEAGYRVVLLEAERIGAGASGRSGGQTLAGLACGQSTLERLVGNTAARAIFDITVEGVRLQRDLIARHAIDCDYVPGWMLTATKPRQDLELRREYETLTTRYAQRGLRWMTRDEVCATIASTRYTSAIFDAEAGHLQPLAYVHGLARAAAAAGARIFENTRALEHTRRSAPRAGLSIRTATGTVHCRAIALCGNAALGNYAPPLARKIVPVGTYVVATEPLAADRARALIKNDAAVSDANWILDYFRLSRDHRLLFGGRVSYSGLDHDRSGAATRARMLKVFPQLADVRVSHAWGGYIDITRNRAPHFGRLESDVYFLQGFSGHGLTLAGMAGRMLADAIAGTDARFDVFARIPHRDFPGGTLLRRPALVLAMLWYRLRDLL